MERPASFGSERHLVAWCVTSIAAVVAAHSIWLLAAIALDAARPTHAAAFGYGVAVVLLGGAAMHRRRQLGLAAIAAAIVAGFGLGLGLGVGGTAALGLATAAAAAVHALGQPWLARRAPSWLDGARRDHRRLAAVWAVLAIACVAQTVRLSAYTVDASSRWAATVPINDPHHQCLSAYLHAAELNRDGAGDVYGRDQYRDGTTGIDGMQPFMKDQYLYPPPFLLGPRLAIAVTNDYDAIRSVWFVARVAGVGLVLILVALAVRDRGPVAALLVPAVWLSLPVQLDLQYGQAHLATLACAMAAMLAFDRDRHGLGGALLAIAVWTKIFPGILLVTLAAQRRWRPIAATAAWGVALLIAGLVVLGPDVFAEYIHGAMPSMARGKTFVGFDPGNLTEDLAIYSVSFRLEVLGGPALGHAVAGGITWVYSAALLALAVIAGRRGAGTPLLWLGLLNLGAFRSPYAPGIYVAAGVVWLLSLLIAERPRARLRVAVFSAVWLAAMASPFLSRLPVFGGSPPLLMLSSLAVQTAAVWCCALAVLQGTTRS